MMSGDKIKALREWIIARGDGEGADVLTKEREDVRLLTSLPKALLAYAKGEDSGAWKAAFDAIRLEPFEAKLSKLEQSQLIQHLIVPAISGAWNKTPDFAQTNVCPRVLELMLRAAPPGKTVIDLEIGTGEFLVQAVAHGKGEVVKAKGFSEPIYRQTKLQPEDAERAKELAELAKVRLELLLGEGAVEINEKPAKAYHYPVLSFEVPPPDVKPVTAYCIPWQCLDGGKSRLTDCISEARRHVSDFGDSSSGNKLALLVPYSVVYGREFKQGEIGNFCRARGLSAVIQLPAGSRGDPKDQPFLLIHQDMPHGYGALPVLFIDATRAPRASEHDKILSADGLNMIVEAFERRESVGQVYVAVHQVDINFFNQGFPPMGRLVEPPSEAEPTLESMREESDRLSREIAKLRADLSDLFDR
jgi:hypothetical protein